MYQSSPGGQSSCSSEPSPLGSATNNDSGVEMAMHSGGSFGDLSVLDDVPVVDSTGSPGTSAGVGLQLRKNRGGLLHLENIKKEKLKTVRDPCSWANASLQVRNTKLPPIPSIGEYCSQKMGLFITLFPLCAFWESNVTLITLFFRLTAGDSKYG